MDDTVQLDKRYEPLPLTPIEKSLLAILSDGGLHTKEELKVEGMKDPLASCTALHQRLFQLRVKLRPLDEDIILQNFGNHSRYKMVRIYYPTSKT